MKSFANKMLLFLLIAALLGSSLSGCFAGGEPEGLIIDPDRMDPGPTPTPVEVVINCDGRLSVSYFSDDSVNPYTTSSRENLAVSGLLHEGLFALSENFSATPMLAHSLTTIDGIRFILTIQNGISFHNGAALTVSDVIYSLDRARGSSLFGGRLGIIANYTRLTDAQGETLPYELEITLHRAHGNLPVLLTFPIIQAGSGGWRVPPGTGPYLYSEDGGAPRLLRFQNHRYTDYLPADVIYLTEFTTVEQKAAHFNDGILDIAGLDPTVAGIPNFAPNREIRYFEASLMDYIGFNINRPETGRLEVRQAISRALNRDYITDNILLGRAVSSPLPLHPALAFYDRQLAAEHACDMDLARELLATPPQPPDPPEDEEEYPYGENGPEDAEAYPYEEDEPEPREEDAPEYDYEAEGEAPEPEPVQLSLLVAAGSTTRMEIARYIAERVTALGYQVLIVERPWHEYLYSLENGNFDLFFAQVRLQPDFDLTELLFGDLAFGGANTLLDPAVIDAFLASSHIDREEAAHAMAAAILEEAPFAVIGFRHLAVATMRGVVSGMRPTQENLYQGVTRWTVSLPSDAET